LNRQSDDPTTAQTLTMAGELRVLLGQLRRRLREEARPGELSASQLSVLSLIEREGPATVSALARAEGVRSQSMGATVSALIAAGMVIGAPDPADGRQTILALTDQCREWIRAYRAAREDWLLRAIQAKLAPEEQQQLATGIELLKRLVAP